MSVHPEVFPEEKVDIEPLDAPLKETPDEEDELEGDSHLFEEKACYVIKKESMLRQFFIKTYEHPKFDQVVLTVIALNCVTLALFDPTDPDCELTKCKILAYFDMTFSLFFMAEMVIKMFAMGVCGEGAYFSTAWNKFDGFIVATSVVDFIGVQLTYLKVFRALRPLRAVNKFPKLKILVKLLLDTIPMMASVGLLCFFIFSIYGILALQLWPGLTHQRCYDSQYPTDPIGYYGYDDDADGGYICSSKDLDQGGYNACPGTHPFCLRKSGMPKDYLTVQEAANPFYGAISYDNIWFCWIVIFQIITMEGWVDQMYIVQGGYSFFAGALFFCSLIVIGSFFSINLALVVIATQFGSSKDEAAQEIKDDEDKELRKKARLKAKAIAAGESQEPNCWTYYSSCMCCDKNMEQKMEILVTRQNKITTLMAAMEPNSTIQIETSEALKVIDNTMKTKKNGKQGTVITEVGVDEALNLPELQCECIQQGGTAPCRFKMRVMVETSACDNFIMGCIGANVAMFATEYHGMTDTQNSILSILNYIFCIIFGIEAVVKIIAYLPNGYFKVPFNVFDFTIVVVSFLEIGTGGGGGLSFLRMFRLVRLFRLVRFLPGLQFQLMVMLQTLGSVFSFLLLLALFIFIYAVLGMFIFGNNLKFEGELDRKNFDTLFWALVTIFQILTLEDWNAAMYAGVRFGGSWCAVYYITLIVLGNYIMFNLFVAILIDGFGGDMDEDADEDEAEAIAAAEGKEALMAIAEGHTLMKRPSLSSSRTLSTEPGSIGAARKSATVSRNVSRRTTNVSQEINEILEGDEGMITTGASSRPATTETKSSEGFGIGSGTGASEELEHAVTTILEPLDTSLLSDQPTPEGEIVQAQTPQADEDAYIKYLKSTPEAGAEPEEPVACQAIEAAPAEAQEPEDQEIPCKAKCFPNLFVRDHSMFCFKPDNKFRILCRRIVAHPVFDQGVIIFILLNSVFMAIESPDLADDGEVRVVLDIANDIFCWVFFCEMMVKWIAMGVYITPDAYFDDGWNRLDGFIVTVSVVDFTMSKIGVGGGMLSMLKICRMFRALRPLRAINKLPNLKRVVDTLIMALDPIGTTLIIIFAFFFIFGILGTQMFMGQFFFCDLADGSGDCEAPRTFCTIVDKAQCIAEGNTWRNQQYNFDHMGRAFMTLFVLSSIDGWVDIMYNGVDVAGVDMQPVRNNRFYLALFFVIFLLVGGFFIINMFVGVIVDNFQKNGKKPDPTEEEIEEERLANIAHKYAVKHENDYTHSYGPFRLKLFKFALGQPFELFIALIIVMNVLTMAMEHYNMSDNFIMFLRLTNYLFTGIFVFEMVAKQAAMGLKEYHNGLRKAWNNFDVFIVFISVLGILIDDVIGPENVPINPSMLKVLRILRVARILKLLKNAKDLVILLTVVAKSLAQVGNLALLLFLLFFIYAALGIELFGKICTDDTLAECNSIGSFAHFRNFGMTMLVLFRLSTGDNWNGILKDALLEPPYCDDSGDTCEKNCCANTVIAPLYFTSFCLVSTFVMLNLVIAVLMAELESANLDEDSEEEDEEEGECEEAKVKILALENSGDKSGEDSIVLATVNPDAKSRQKSDIPTLCPIESQDKEDIEETTDTLEQQVNDALQREPEKSDPKNKIESLEAEVEEIVSYQSQSSSPNSLPSLNAPKDPSTPGRPSHFVPFAPGLVASDEQDTQNQRDN